MTFEDVTPIMAQGFVDGEAVGRDNGGDVDVPYCRPEMSLTKLRLKSGYPLPLHSHDCNCLYYVASGSLTIGTEQLVAGDGFFVGIDVPYGYVAGPNGATVLEFRATDQFNIRMQIKTETAWNKLTAQFAEGQERWATESLPELT